MLVHLDGKNRGRSHRARHCDREQPDRSATSDSNRLGRNLSRQHAVHGVSQRIQNRRVLLRNGRIELPDIRFRNHHVFGKRPVGIHADDLHVLADVGFAGAALQTLAAGHVHLRGNKVAFFHAGDFVAEGRHLAAKFMAGNQGRMNPVLRPAVPLVNVQISAADGSDFYLDQHIVPAKRRNLDFADLRARRGFRLDHREHRFLHEGQPVGFRNDQPNF